LIYVEGFLSDEYHPMLSKSFLFVLYSVPFVSNNVNISICSKYTKSIGKVQCNNGYPFFSGV
jgi:hypothetical protein